MMAATILNQGSSGFYKAPVCKGILSTVFVTCISSHLPVVSTIYRSYLSCELPSTLFSCHIWKIILNRLAFVQSKDFLCAALLIYYFRIFEKRMGSKKFADFLFAGTCLGTAIEILFLCWYWFLTSYLHGHRNEQIVLPPSLCSLVFPLFVIYYYDVPCVTVTRFLGLSVTGKTVTYLLGLQIASESPLAATAGLVAGVLYIQNFFRVKQWLFIPGKIAYLFWRCGGLIFESKEPKFGQMGATLELQRQEQVEMWEQQYFHNRAHDFRQDGNLVQRTIQSIENQRHVGVLNSLFSPQQTRYQTTEPSDENISSLVQMGFDRDGSTQALRSTANDVTAAANILLRQ